MSEFTPGPWEWGDNESVLYNLPSLKMVLVSEFDPDDEAAFIGWGEHKKANAALIAAAPDMYEALEALMAVIDSIKPLPSGGIPLHKAYHMGMDALKYARGEVTP